MFQSKFCSGIEAPRCSVPRLRSLSADLSVVCPWLFYSGRLNFVVGSGTETLTVSCDVLVLCRVGVLSDMIAVTAFHMRENRTYCSSYFIYFSDSLMSIYIIG